jgi:putative acetyltransferase
MRRDDVTNGSTHEVRIRREHPDDASAIDDVVGRAFAPDVTVAPLVRLIRASDRYLPALALVAVLDDEIIGHVMVSTTDLIDDTGTCREVLTLSPVSVAPPHQRHGVGTRLVSEVLARADARGEPLVTVEGHPTYYPRFGFQLASELGISITLPSWAPPEAAMARRLSSYDPACRGRLVLPPAFDDVSGVPPPAPSR